ncbi:MAG: hypothetical protein Q7I99_08350 [Acholeplasmataceae bacterium]|nr:hypothetical protein [Acholeplasmataceae bacterium]
MVTQGYITPVINNVFNISSLTANGKMDFSSHVQLKSNEITSMTNLSSFEMSMNKGYLAFSKYKSNYFGNYFQDKLILGGIVGGWSVAFGHLGKSLPSFDKALFGVFGYILTGVSSIASAIMYESYYSSLGLDDNEYRTAIMLENGNLLATTAAALLVAGILTSTGVGAPIGVVIVAVVGASIVVDYFYDKIVDEIYS